MRKKKLQAMVRNDCYQVFLLTCAAHFPVASHPWFVVNQNGKLSRWSVSFNRFDRSESVGHLNTNLFEPFLGVPLPLLAGHAHYPTRLLGCIEGNEGSVAARMGEVITASFDTYPYIHTYRPLGPNSNTYVQWVLDQFPDCGLKLPWNSFGSGYHRRHHA